MVLNSSWEETVIGYPPGNHVSSHQKIVHEVTVRGKLRWFLHNIQAIMANIKIPKKPHNMVVFLINVRRSYWDLSSQADPTRDIEFEVIHISI